MNLNQVTLPVIDMKDAVEFYQLMGFNLIVDTAHYARFECPIGGSSFSLSLENGTFNNSATIYFEYEELDAWVNELKEKGIQFLQEPEMQSYLWKEAVLKDPSGNKIKLYWAGENRLNPPWRIN